MTDKEIREKLESSLVRTGVIGDPEYIIGEDKTIDQYGKWVDECKNVMMGSVILGQIGNGKTHFLRYVRKKYQDNDMAVGIYMPDMFFNGPLIDSLNSLYGSLFKESINNDLVFYLPFWNEVKQEETEKKYPDNNIIRYLSHCSNEDEKKLVLNYFSNKDLFPDQISYMRKKFAAKKKFINNENDFVKAFVDALQFIQYVTHKKILLFIDEVDKVYSNSTNTISFTRVGAKILTTYRTLFDYLNSCNIEGIITIGATIEAWEVLSHQTAFERRFKDHKVVLKTPKEKADVVEFIQKRFREINITVDSKMIEDIEKYISYLTDYDMKSWADIISALLSRKKAVSEEVIIDPQRAILEVLDNALSPLTWEQMLENSKVLRNIYPNGQPNRVLQNMYKDGKIIINSSKPNTYEIA